MSLTDVEHVFSSVFKNVKLFKMLSNKYNCSTLHKGDIHEHTAKVSHLYLVGLSKYQQNRFMHSWVMNCENEVQS